MIFGNLNKYRTELQKEWDLGPTSNQKFSLNILDIEFDMYQYLYLMCECYDKSLSQRLKGNFFLVFFYIASCTFIN